MKNVGLADGRLELHLEATGRGRRMMARLADGTVLATGRNYADLLKKINAAAAASYPAGVKLALMMGRHGPSPMDRPLPGAPAPRLHP